MDLYFNELSIKHRDSLDYTEAVKLAEVYQLLKKHDYNTCRIDIQDHEKLFSMVDRLPNSINIKNFYYSFFKLPFESDSVNEKEDRFYEHVWTYKEQNCFGLAIAYLMDSFSYSIFQDEWNYCNITIYQDDQKEKVKNISTKQHVEFYFTAAEEDSDILLEKCNKHFSEKGIHLREDHGMDKLTAFAEKLVHSPYVVEVINSLPYNPKKRRFIKEIKADGLIEIVLPWTDCGLGLVVRTTGRTKKETDRIAHILEEKYGYV